MALVTITDMYHSFLKGIGKKRTSAVWPADFNVIINEAYKEWLRQKTNEADVTQQRIDDLQKLKYITDSSIEVLVSSTTRAFEPGDVNSDTYDSVTGLRTVIIVLGGNTSIIVYQRLIPLKPRTGTINIFDILPTNYPAYYRLQSIQAMVTLSGVDYGYIGSKPIKADNRTEILRDPYRKPLLDTNDITRSRIYHLYVQDRIHLVLPDNVSGKYLLIEYVKRPLDLVYDPNNSNNNVDCELDTDQQQQIVDIAVRGFIEQVENKRFQTVLTQEQIKHSDK